MFKVDIIFWNVFWNACGNVFGNTLGNVFGNIFGTACGHDEKKQHYRLEQEGQKKLEKRYCMDVQRWDLFLFLTEEA